MRIARMLTTAALCAAAAHPAAASLIVNGNFDADTVTGSFAVVTPTGSFQMTGWRVIASGNNATASVDLVRAPYWQAHSGLNSVDLFGSGTLQPSFLAQTFSVAAGQTGDYRISFFYSVNTDGPLDQGLVADVVQGNGVGGTSVATSPTSFFYDIPTDGSPTKANMAWKQGFLDFTAATAGDYTLWFRGNPQFGNSNQGAALDSVSIDAAVVPLPAAAWLMLGGLGLLFGATSRQRRSES